MRVWTDAVWSGTTALVFANDGLKDFLVISGSVILDPSPECLLRDLQETFLDLNHVDLQRRNFAGYMESSLPICWMTTVSRRYSSLLVSTHVRHRLKFYENGTSHSSRRSRLPSNIFINFRPVAGHSTVKVPGSF